MSNPWILKEETEEKQQDPSSSSLSPSAKKATLLLSSSILTSLRKSTKSATSYGVSAADTELLWERQNSNLDELEDALSLEPSSISKWGVFLLEAKLLGNLAIPSILIQFSLYAVFPQAASAVGRHLGTVELGGFSLGCLVGNLSCLSFIEGVLSAADTLMPRAYGNENYKELLRLVIRAYIVCCTLLVPLMIPLCMYSSSILIRLGQDPEASYLAQQWIQYYLWGVPANLTLRIFMRFLMSQDQPWPLVLSTILPCLVICPLLLLWLVPKFKLQGSAMAISLTQWSMLIMLILLLKFQRHQQEQPYKVHHRPTKKAVITWSSSEELFQLMKEAIEWKSLATFYSLGVAGVFSLSRWWFWEVMCFIAGTFGVVSLVAHTIAYNLVPLVYMITLGVMVGLSVRMGHVIAKDPHRAKLLATYCMIFIILLGSIISTFIYTLRLQIIQLFAKDKDVIEMCLKIWPYVTMYIFLMNIQGINEGIYRGLGRQWRLATIMVISLYFLLLPAVIYFAMMKGGGLQLQWRLMPPFYFILQIVLIIGYVVTDWDDISLAVAESMRKSIKESLRLRKPIIIYQSYNDDDDDDEGSNSFMNNTIETISCENNKILIINEKTSLITGTSKK